MVGNVQISGSNHKNKAHFVTVLKVFPNSGLTGLRGGFDFAFAWRFYCHRVILAFLVFF